MIKPGVWVEDPCVSKGPSEEIQERFRVGDTTGALALIKEHLWERMEPFRGGVLTKETVHQMKASAEASIQRMVERGYTDSYEIYTTDLDPTLPTHAAVSKRAEQARPAYYLVAYLDSPYLQGNSVQIVIEVSA